MIIKDMNAIISRLWPEEQYSVMNVLYKSAKNVNKLEKALIKHQKKILIYAKEHVCSNEMDYVAEESRKAFSAVLAYYEGNLEISML